MVSVFFRTFYTFRCFLPGQKIPRGEISMALSKKHPSEIVADRFPEVAPVCGSRKRLETLRTHSRGLRSKWEVTSHILRVL